MMTNNDTSPAEDIEICDDCGIEVTSELQSQHVQDLCDFCERKRVDAYPALLKLAEDYANDCTDRIHQLRDDLKEDFGDPDDLQEQIEHWQETKRRCDVIIAQAHGKAA